MCNGIRNPEIGVFKINWVRLRELAKQTDVDGREIDELFRKTELDGFVREVDDKDKIVIREDPRLADVRRFRLHHRFAPVFGFSFRGPYGEFSLSESAFIEVVLAQKDFSLKEWVRSLDLGQANVELRQEAGYGIAQEPARADCEKIGDGTRRFRRLRRQETSPSVLLLFLHD